MIVGEDQVTPTHFHCQKMEDIINRGGGNLVIRLWNADRATRQLADSRVTVSMDGVRVTVARRRRRSRSARASPSACRSGSTTASGARRATGTVLVGEVSRVNDDHVDNRFLDPVGRFPNPRQQEPPLLPQSAHPRSLLRKSGSSESPY